MKKFLAIALVALLALSTVMAAPTLKGRIYVGYDFSEDGTTAWDSSRARFTVAGEAWSATLTGWKGAGANAVYVGGAWGTVDLNKALSDVDFQGFTVKVNFNSASAPVVYADPTGASTTIGLAKAYAYSADIAKGDIAVRVAAGTDANEKWAFGANVKATVADGISATAGAKYDAEAEAWAAIGSAKADLAQFIEVDGLAADVSALAIYNSDEELTVKAAVTGSYEAAGVYAEYVLAAETSAINAGVSYDINDKISVGADASIADLSDVAVTADAWISIALADVTVGADVYYADAITADAYMLLSF